MSERTSSVLRRPHKKARTGCTLCKRRRVKCGEEKPECRNCSAHGATCVYEAVASRRRPLPKASASPGPSIQSSQGDTPAFTLDHMELMHHYTASTALTLSSVSEVKEVWRDNVPRIALQTDYVLHALLALSAMHLSQIRPHDGHSYWTMGFELYQAALGKAQAEMENVTDKNCTELFLFSTLTCFYSLAHNGELATRSDQGDDDDQEEMDVLGWVFLFRGTKTLLMLSHRGVLEKGALAPMFEHGGERAGRLRAYSPADSDAIMDELRVIVPDASEQAIYWDAVQHLQRTFRAVYSRASVEIETTDIFMWLFEVSDEYMDRLKRYEGPALAVFMCYSLLVGTLRGIWWAKGWGEWISGRLRDKLLDGERKFSDRLMELLVVVVDTSGDSQ
ncbi:hypothetical protein Daus18300_013853 [Diaporthe australafricana]|uniref:Zn(2)-C6 fungal-type domain-containing protein n=1 Tax=Diaporthe australafricana TaxID=127596 RepID=A0ABR3VXG6_9PEZI